MDPVSHHDTRRNDSHVIDRALISHLLDFLHVGTTRRETLLLSHLTNSRSAWHDGFVFLSLWEEAAGSSLIITERKAEILIEKVWAKKKKEVDRGSYPWCYQRQGVWSVLASQGWVTALFSLFFFFSLSIFCYPARITMADWSEGFWSLNGVSEMFKSHLMTSAFLNCSFCPATFLAITNFSDAKRWAN